jgi:hypothetical protein
VCCCDEQETLVSLLDDRDLLALRLVSRKTRDWVDAVLPSQKSKAITLYAKKNTDVDELMDEKISRGIPFFRGLNVKDSFFFSHPQIPSFLRSYGPQIHTVYSPKYYGDVDPKEVAFYEALPNLIQLSTRWLGDNVPAVKMPALERLQLHTIRSKSSDRTAKIDFDFLLNFRNLTHLWLPYMNLAEHVQVLCALGPYFKKWNGLEGSSRRTLTILLRPFFGISPDKLSPSEKENVVNLLQELAVADGRINIENMNVRLLDEAVRLFHRQRGGQLLLSSFGKCVRSLVGFSSCLYEVELPNMRKLDVHCTMEETTARDGDYSKTVSWPNLEEINLKMRNESLAKLVFGSGGLRPSVKRLDCDLTLIPVFSKEAHLLLANFPNLTHLELGVNEVTLFRSLMRMLPTNCSKIQFLHLTSFFRLEDEDFLGVDEEGGLTTPPLLQLPGK